MRFSERAEASSSLFQREGPPEALSTVSAFQDELTNRLRRFLEKKDDWESFQISREEKAIKPIVGSEPNEGTWLSQSAKGIVNDVHEVTLSVGIWWNPPSIRVPVIVYASFFEGPKELKKFKWKSASKHVRFEEISKVTRAFVAPSPNFTWEMDLDLALNALLSAVKPQSAELDAQRK